MDEPVFSDTFLRLGRNILTEIILDIIVFSGT